MGNSHPSKMGRAVAKFDALLEALDFVSFGQPMEHEAYFCVSTGVIHYHSEYGDVEEPLPADIEDSEEYIPIPHKNDLGLGKPLALQFATEFLPADAASVRDIFMRSGANARFKNLLEDRGMLQRWYEYEAKYQQESLREWCDDNGIQIDG